MKSYLGVFISLFLCTLATRADIIYSGVQDVPIPQDFDGEYLRLDTGTTSGVFPGNWSTAPWINPFFGGVAIANSPLLRPVITGFDQIADVSSGTLINGASNFVAGESGSSTHVGSGVGQFQLGAPGYIGFVFEHGTGGPDYYGWMNIVINNNGAGRIVDWAYQDSANSPIAAGEISAVPEPGTVLFGAATAAAIACRRRLRK